MENKRNLWMIPTNKPSRLRYNILNNYVLFSYLYKKDTIKLSCTDKLFQKIIVNQIKN